MLDIVTESSAYSKRIIEIITELPTINQHCKRDVLFLLERVLNDPSNDLQGLILAILQHNDRYVSIFVEDKVELELRESRMKLVEGNERRCCCLGGLEEEEENEDVDYFAYHYTCYLRL